MKKKYYFHETALVDEGSNVGNDTRVWAFAHIMAGAVIGERCNIGEHSFIESGAMLGNEVTVKNCVQIWEGVTAEDGVFFGPSCVLTNHNNPRAFVKRSKDQWLKKTLIKEGATIGANATIICGTTLGEYCFVAAGCVVTRDVPAYALVVGNPAKHHDWVCECANRLELTTDSTSSQLKCDECNSLYEEHLNDKKERFLKKVK